MLPECFVFVDSVASLFCRMGLASGKFRDMNEALLFTFSSSLSRLPDMAGISCFSGW
jgi:hypothetical protein